MATSLCIPTQTYLGFEENGLKKRLVCVSSLGENALLRSQETDQIGSNS